MQSGAMDREITIMIREQSSGQTGSRKDEFSAVDTVWAQYKPISGREALIAGEEAAQFDAIFRIYWRDDVSEKDQIKFDGMIFDIQSITQIGMRHEGLEIRARKLR